MAAIAERVASGGFKQYKCNFCIYMYKPREVSGSINIHPGGEVMCDLYLFLLICIFSSCFLKNIHNLCHEKQAVYFERSETSSNLGSGRVKPLALCSPSLVGCFRV